MTKCLPDILDHVDFIHSRLGDSAKLHESALASIGRILTLGCEHLTEKQLGATMALGQRIKEHLFLLRSWQESAFHLGVSLAESMGLTADAYIDLLSRESREAPATNDIPTFDYAAYLTCHPDADLEDCVDCPF